MYVGLSQNHYTTQRTDSVEQVIAHVVCIIETLLTALAQFEIGTSKNGVKELPILQSLLCTLTSLLKLTCCMHFFFRLSYSVMFVSWYFTFALWVMLCAFDCCGRRLVDVVQVHIAHMRCPGTRPHLQGERTNMLDRM